MCVGAQGRALGEHMVSEPNADSSLDGDTLAEDFAVLARALQAQDTVQHTLEVMCRLAVHAIEGAEHAGITVIRSGRFETPAASGCCTTASSTRRVRARAWTPSARTRRWCSTT